MVEGHPGGRFQKLRSIGVQWSHGLLKPREGRRIGKNVNGLMRDTARTSENIRSEKSKLVKKRKKEDLNQVIER